MTDSSFFENKNILVTGSSGLLGSWLVEDLLNQKASVTGVSLDNTKDQLLQSKKIIDKIENHYIDISSYEDIKKIVSNKNFDLIFHLAAQTQQFLPQDDLIILESMKMEIPLKLDSKGTIVKILVNEGDLIKEDQNLLEYVDSE